MGKEQVYEFLKKHSGQKFTARQIGIAVNQEMSVYSNLRLLRKEKSKYRLWKDFHYEIKEDPNSGRMTRRYWVEK